MEAKQLAAFKSHKTVHAGRIKDIGPVITPEAGVVGRNLGIEAADGRCYAAFCDAEMFTRYFPQVDDFYVVYSAGTDDEYASISPAKAFEEGYRGADGSTVSIFKGGEPDARQGTAEAPGLFRKRYRQLAPIELEQHDRIKDLAEQLAGAIGALNPTVYARLLGVTAEGDAPLGRDYDGAGVTLALRHLEDAVYRAVKALTA